MTPDKQRRRVGSRLDAHGDSIVGMIKEEKDITLNEMICKPPVKATGQAA